MHLTYQVVWKKKKKKGGHHLQGSCRAVTGESAPTHSLPGAAGWLGAPLTALPFRGRPVPREGKASTSPKGLRRSPRRGERRRALGPRGRPSPLRRTRCKEHLGRPAEQEKGAVMLRAVPAPPGISSDPQPVGGSEKA